LNGLEPLERVVLVGVMNLDLLVGPGSQNFSRVSTYQDFMVSHGFLGLIDRVTRPASGTCIDHVFVRNCEDILQILSGVIATDLTDHYPVFALFAGVAGIMTVIENEAIRVTRDMSPLNMVHFRSVCQMRVGLTFINVMMLILLLVYLLIAWTVTIFLVSLNRR
jgi:hypothetical protein